MAITYGAGPGTVITSFAMDETLGDQSQQSGNNQVVVSDDVSTAGNGQIGSKFSTYVGRLVIIDIAGTPQIRMVTSQAAGSGNTIILTVGEDWDTNPVQTTDTIHVFYDIDDIETGGAGGGINLNSKTGLYEFTNDITIGNATDPAGLQVNTGIGTELDDGGASVVSFVKNNGYLYFGYAQAGQNIAGGINTFVNNANTEPTWRWESGSKGKILDSVLWGQLGYYLFYECQNGSGAEFEDSKFINLASGSTFFDAAIRGCSMLGSGNSAELIRIDAGTIIEGLVLINTAGLTTASGDTTTESLTCRDVVFVGNYYELSINSNKTWYMVNPVWSVTTYTDLNWLTSTSNYVYDQRSVDVVVQEADGTKIQNANVLIYEDTILADLVLETYTDANGEASGVFTYKYHQTNSATTTYGGHAFRVDCWDYFPFAAAQVSTDKREGVITLALDPNIAAASQAAALTDGSGITWNEDTNPSSIIEFTGGSGTLSVGQTVTATPSGADGIVTKIVDGDSAAGTVHLKTRDANAFASGDSLANGAGWTANYTASSQQDFSVWIDGNSKSMQVIHDYLAALTSETTLSATGELIHEWGKGNEPRALYLGSSGFYTERSDALGVFITNFGAGTIQKFTDDTGATWTPPTSVTLTVTCKNTSGLAVEGVKVRIETTGGTLIAEGATNSSGVFTSLYDYTGDVNVNVIARLKGYKNNKAASTIESGGMSIPFAMIRDAAVDLP